jgi:hypothetical protein
VGAGAVAADPPAVGLQGGRRRAADTGARAPEGLIAATGTDRPKRTPPASHRTLGTWLASGGAVAQVAGFGVDAWLHARDPGLAARESVLSLENAGHVLVAGGLLLVVAGLGLFWAGVRALPAVAVLAVAVGLAAAIAPATPHQHPPDQDASVAEARARAADVIPGLLHGHEDPPDPRPMDAATRRALAEQLVEARAVALRYPTVADAEAAGYRMVVPYVPLIGAH